MYNPPNSSSREEQTVLTKNSPNNLYEKYQGKLL